MYFSQRWLANIAGCSRQWANECIQLLKKLGLIESKRRRYSYGWRTNIYSVNPDLFKPHIRWELFTILSSLRGFIKKTTQLKNEKDIISYSIVDTVPKENPLLPEVIFPDKPEALTPKKEEKALENAKPQRSIENGVEVETVASLFNW